MQTIHRKNFLRVLGGRLALAVAATALLASPQAFAQQFPTKPVKLVSPYSPGGSSDILARALAEGMSKSLGQPVIVENLAGGAGAIGGQAVANAAPDGYTLFMGGIGINVITPLLNANQAFKPREQLVPVSQAASYQPILVVRADSPINSLADMLVLGKKDKGIAYGTTGVTSSNYLGTEVLKHESGMNLIHVSYRGESNIVQDLIGGSLELANISVSVALPYIKAGRLKAVVTMYPTRVKDLPDVASVTETYPECGVDPWFGLFTTRGTPPSVVRQLHAAAQAALADKNVASTLEQRGYLTKPSRSPEEFAALMQKEGQAWQRSLKKAGIIKD